MTRCTRCGRITLRPEYLSGKPYGPVCIAKVSGHATKPARAGKVAKRRRRAADKAVQGQRDGETMDLFEEIDDV